MVINGVDTFHNDRGTGRPVLFLHGNPDTADMWLPVIGGLQDQARCLAPDLPGFGRSKAAESFDCSLDAMASWVDGFLDAAGVRETVTLVVHDFGGPYGFAWAVKHPERVAGMVISNTVFFADYRWHTWARAWRTPVLGELSLWGMNWPAYRSQMKKASPRLTEEQIRHQYSFITSATKKMILKLYRATDPENFRDWTPRLLELLGKVPSRVLWADRDPYIEPHWAERFAGARITHFAECSHWLPLEEPDAVAEHVRQLL